MRAIPVLLLVLILSCKSKKEKEISLPELLSGGKWIDLSYSFSDSTLYWPNNPTGFRLDTQFNGTTSGGFYYSSNIFCSPEHGGTHLDAPVHFARGKWSVDQVPLEQLIGQAVVIDVSQKASGNPDYQVSVADITEWENVNGRIEDGAILLFRTGWGKFYPDAARYLGTAEKGQEAVAKLHFPSIHPELATWLVQNRKLKAVGIDTPSVDYGQSTDFKTHQVLYAENIPGMENLANLEQIPVKGAYLVGLPMKIKDGSGGPLRAMAWVKAHSEEK